jgi:hypothetical protein
MDTDFDSDGLTSRDRVIAAADKIMEALSDLNRYGDDVDRRLASNVYADVQAGLYEVLNVLHPGRAADIHNAAIESGFSVAEAIEHCRQNRWATDLEVPVTVLFRVHDGEDIDRVRKVLARHIEHGSFRDGVITALGASGVQAGYDGAYLTDLRLA